MGEPEARKRLRDEREKAKAERKAAEREPMNDKRLADIGMVLEVTERPSLWHELYDEAMRARAELARAQDELDARIAAESADAAAGSYAGRAEEAEAALAAVRAELADHLATECVDAAAGQNAERAEKAEAKLAALRAQQGTPRVQYGVRYPGWPTVSEAPGQEAARAWVEEYSAWPGASLDPGNPRARVQRRTITVTRSATAWEDVDG